MFRAPKRTLGDLDATSAAELIAAAADIALILDAKGVIKDVSLGDEDLKNEGFKDLVGTPWIDTVTVESRPKVEALLRDAKDNAPKRWRQINHPSKGGPDIPMRYAALLVSDSGRMIAVGRDLRPIATLQQRLVDAQQSMEREYARLRHAETRYRLLFQIAAQPVAIVDANSLKVVEANPAASELLGKSIKRLSGRSFIDLFESDSGKAVQTYLAQVRNAGHAEEITARLQSSKIETTVGASLFRQDASAHFLIRFSAVDSDPAVPKAGSKLLSVVENLPDGFVITDPGLQIVTTNPAFLDLAELTSEEQTRGEPFDRWIGRPGVDLDAIVSNIHEHGSVRNFATIVRGEYGAEEEVEISAVSVLTGEYPCYAFTIRSAGRREAVKPRPARELPHSVEQLTKLVGRVTLKELVRETTDVIERLCIEAALELTGDNRASAAEMLGLSRQSLYSKLRRFGITDIDSD
ncbi:MAG: transcriptional regulator PpsR [Pseudomonadota bacterium]